MKKAVTCILIASLVILLVFSCFGCSDKSKDILGDWYFDSGLPHNHEWNNPNIFDDTDRISFSEDGTLIVSNLEANLHNTFTWEYNKKDKNWTIYPPSTWSTQKRMTATIDSKGHLSIVRQKENGDKIGITFWRKT